MKSLKRNTRRLLSHWKGYNRSIVDDAKSYHGHDPTALGERIKRTRNKLAAAIKQQASQRTPEQKKSHRSMLVKMNNRVK